MADLLEIYSSYAPPPVLRRLAAEPSGKHAPIAERMPASMLFADISGFTKLAERLARKGPAGAEELSQILNRYFEQLLELVASHGGEVVDFAGDGLLALWPVAEGDQDLATASRRAAQCGLAVQGRLHAYETGEDAELSLRIGVGAGELFAASVGGERDRWMFFLAGTPLAETGDAQRQARPGEVVVTSSVWAHLPAGTFRGRALAERGVRLLEVLDPVALRSRSPSVPGEDALPALRGYIPSTILSRLEAGQIGWLAELRRLTVVFIRVIGVDYAAPTEEVSDQVSSIMQSLQTSVYRFDGSISQFRADDKGIVLLASFGLPPRTHEDDASRAVLAALEAHGGMRALGFKSAVGVATGQVFCGDIGGPARRDFTMIGDVVNLAARLQEVQADGVLTDAATSDAGRGLATFQRLPPFELKGKAEPVVVYRPLPEPAEAARPSPIVGREEEVALLHAQLEALEAGNGGLVLVEGEAGIGKSRLVAELLHGATGRDVSILSGSGEAIERSTPYHPWRSILTKVLDLGEIGDPEAERAQVLAQLEPDPEVLELAPLLNAVLPLDLPPTETTAKMTDLADHTHDLVARILQRAADERGLLIVLEDAHWLDSASWALTRLVAMQVRPLLLVLVRRPMQEVRESRQLRELPETVRIQLGGLSEVQTKALLENRLGIPTASEGLASLVHSRSEGNPFFAEELTYAMRDQGLILVTDGECSIAPGISDIAQLTPDTVQSVITSRLGRLTPPQQMTVKVASVIGRVFPLETLRDVYPIEADRTELPSLLDELHRLDIAITEAPEPGETFAFRHAITQEVAYGQLPASQRRKLHRSVAEWYESRDGEGLAAYYPVLAHHWTQAEVPSKAKDYLVKAGEQALRSFANEEAVKLLSEALTLDDRAEDGGDRLRRAGWEVLLGRAYVNWSHYAAGLSHLRRGLRLVDRAVPGSSLGQLTGVLAQVMRQFVHRLRGAPAEEREPEARARLLAASEAYERVVEVAYFAAEELLAMYAAFRGLNLAEAAGGDSPELARAYANVGALMGFIPLRRFRGVADAYVRRAQEVLDRVESLPAQMWVSLAVGSHYVGQGEWSKAQTRLERVVEVSEQLGDTRHRGDGASQLMALHAIRGNLEEGSRLASQLYESGRRRNYVNHQAWGLQGMVIHLLQVGRFDEALQRLEELEGLLADLDPPEEVLESEAHGLRAVAHFRRAEYVEALDRAEALAAVADKSALPPTNFSALTGYAGAAEVLLGLLELRHRLPAELQERHTQIRKMAGAACKRLGRYSGVFRIGRGRTALYRSLYEWHSGKSAKALLGWRGALASAERLDMPYDQALALYELGRHLEPGDPSRQEHLERAARIFEEVGAEYDLAHAQLELARPRTG